jgi:hypothetical protein
MIYPRIEASRSQRTEEDRHYRSIISARAFNHPSAVLRTSFSGLRQYIGSYLSNETTHSTNKRKPFVDHPGHDFAARENGQMSPTKTRIVNR